MKTDIQKLGSGFSRNSYLIKSKNIVMKIAKNQEGINQNINEYSIYKKTKSPIITKTFKISKDGTYVLSEYCYITSSKNQKQLHTKIKKITTLKPNIFYLLLSCSHDKHCFDIIQNNKNDFTNFCYWCQKNRSFLIKLHNQAKKNQSRTYIHYMTQNIPEKLLVDSNHHNFCLHYFFWSCPEFIKNIDIDYFIKLIDYKYYKTIRFIKYFKDLEKITGNSILDSVCDSNLGIVSRNGKDHLVILDYGYQEK